MKPTPETNASINTVAAVLAQARASGIDRLDAHMMLSALLDQPRSWLLAHDDEALSDDQLARATQWFARRAAGEPLAYLLGQKEFHGLMLQVSPAVLVPRPDTETLVEWALQLIDAGLEPSGAPSVIDLGTGSGAIALAIKHSRPQAQVTALDTSLEALTIARHNGQQLQLEATWLHSDWWQAVAGQQFNLAVSNPPYVAGGDPHLAALTHEPLGALTPGGDGLDAIRQIVASAAAHLLPGSWMLFEHGHDQADAVTALLQQHQFGAIETRRDLAGNARCTGGRRP